MSPIIEGVEMMPLRQIPAPGGDVLHALKATDAGFAGFGEAYFSTIDSRVVKAWKRHREMTLNLVVPVGAIRFVIHDDRDGSPTRGVFDQVVLSRSNYCRLTIPPMLWMGFQGVAKSESILLNVASIPHDPDEVDRLDERAIDFDWSEKR